MKEKQSEGSGIVLRHTITAMGVGLIPVPMVDMLGVTAVQLNMVRRLAKNYEVPFNEHKYKSVLSSLLGAGVTLPVGSILGSLIKSIPLVGQTVGAVSMSISTGALTYAVGKVFNMHFATGGTFLSFDAEEMKGYFQDMLKEGKEVAEGLKAA